MTPSLSLAWPLISPFLPSLLPFSCPPPFPSVCAAMFPPSSQMTFVPHPPSWPSPFSPPFPSSICLPSFSLTLYHPDICSSLSFLLSPLSLLPSLQFSPRNLHPFYSTLGEGKGVLWGLFRASWGEPCLEWKGREGEERRGGRIIDKQELDKQTQNRLLFFNMKQMKKKNHPHF